jgi:pyrimidine deaminase RibD-like protein
MNDREIFEKLFEIGKSSKDREGVVVAGLVEDGKIIVASPSADDGIRHAEDLVIEMAKKNNIPIGKSIDLYTTVEPCTFRNPEKKMIPCATLIVEAGIKKVIFAAHDPKYKHDSEKILQKAGVDIRQIGDKDIIKKSLEVYSKNLRMSMIG